MAIEFNFSRQDKHGLTLMKMRKIWSSLSAMLAVPISIGRLAFFEMTVNKGMYLLVMLGVFLVLLSPMLVTGEERTLMVPMTKTQIACFMAWCISFIYGSIQISLVGEAQKTQNLLCFWRGVGVIPVLYFIALLIPQIVLTLVLNSAASIAYVSAYFGQGVSVVGLLALSVQFTALTTLVNMCFFSVTLGMSTRLNAAVAVFLTFGAWVYCVHGVSLLSYINNAKPNIVTEVLWAFSPQLRLGDITNRLVFNWGAMAIDDFFVVLCYCASWFVVFFSVGYVTFNTKRYD